MVPPTNVEIDALATLIHSFYNGIENILKRIAIHLDGGLPHGEDSHTRLLENMTRPKSNRGAVISLSLHAKLKDYMDFRHFFRHAYAYNLDWLYMSQHVFSIEDTFNQLKNELEQFISTINPEDSE